MRDSKVDLCGELMEQEDVFETIGRQDSFRFACAGCGDCCRGREDIVLSGYDLYRIAVRLGLPPRLAANAFCRQYMGRATLMPVMRLQPVEGARHNCPFLHESRCSIHSAKPLVCALYPLGQSIERDGTIEYFLQPTECGGQVFEAKLQDYLESMGIAQRERLDADWALTCIALAKRMKELRRTSGDTVLRAAQRHIREALYLNYDITRSYEEQFRENLSWLDGKLTRLEGVRRKAGE